MAYCTKDGQRRVLHTTVRAGVTADRARQTREKLERNAQVALERKQKNEAELYVKERKCHQVSFPGLGEVPRYLKRRKAEEAQQRLQNQLQENEVQLPKTKRAKLGHSPKKPAQPGPATRRHQDEKRGRNRSGNTRGIRGGATGVAPSQQAEADGSGGGAAIGLRSATGSRRRGQRRASCRI